MPRPLIDRIKTGYNGQVIPVRKIEKGDGNPGWVVNGVVLCDERHGKVIHVYLCHITQLVDPNILETCNKIIYGNVEELINDSWEGTL